MDKGGRIPNSGARIPCGGCICVMDPSSVRGRTGCNSIVPPWKLNVVSMGPESKIESIAIPDDADPHVRGHMMDVKFVSGRRCRKYGINS